MLDVMDVPVPGVIETMWAVGEEGGGDIGGGLGDTGAGDEADLGDTGGAGDEGGASEDGTGGEGGGGEGLPAGDGAAGAGGEGAAGEVLSGTKLWNAVKDGIKALDPHLQKSINKAIHKLQGIEKSLPEGGIEQVTKTLTAVKQLSEDPSVPVEKAIADTLAERGYFRELDQAYTEGSPAFVEKLATAKPEAFDRLAPEVFAKYAQTNPDGFSAYVAGTVLNHMNQAEVPLQFRVLATFLPQLPDGPAKTQVVDAIEAIYGWSQSLRGLAAKKPAEVKPGEQQAGGKAGANGKPGDEVETLRQQNEQLKTTATLQNWNTEALEPGIRSVNSEADKYAAGKKYKLDDADRKKVLVKVGEELDIRLAGNKGYGETMRGYLKAGNKQAFLQRLESERKKLIPGAVRRAVDDVVAERPKAAVKSAAVKGAAVKTAGAQAGGGDGVEWIAGHPSTQGLTVDLNRTTHAMLLKKQAYVKGRNTKVSWK
jgi:hypothetical protein